MAKKTRKRPAAEPALATAAQCPEWRTIGWLRRHAVLTAVLLVVIGSLRIVATYSVFSHTSDEPAHIACGMQWLDRGVYLYEAQHPPLARIAAALGPYLAGIRPQNQPTLFPEGVAILYHGLQYSRTLALARLGILPFFWIAAAVVFLWARRDRGELEAVLAVFFFTFLPPVLAHAGLATTDMALTAFAGAAFLSALIWLEDPSLLHGAVFGACAALAVLSKFSALPFLAAAAAAALAWYFLVMRPGLAGLWNAVRSRAASLAVAIACSLLVIWAGYRFSFGPVPITHCRLPAPELYRGILEVFAHNKIGHLCYLLGERSQYGFWYYFPVVLALKSPVPFLLLLALGVWIACSRAELSRAGLWLPLAFSAGILLFSLTSNITIGIRHILPVYIGFSILAAAAGAYLLARSRDSRLMLASTALLFAWFAGSSLAAHPDYLAYFNWMAGSSPEGIAVDSDLDWGQDIGRLAARLREAGAQEVTFTTGITGVERALPRMLEGYVEAPNPGWNAVSVTNLRQERMGLKTSHPEIVPWPERLAPREKVGKSIWLYYFAPGGR
jgi:hypothetical protein